MSKLSLADVCKLQFQLAQQEKQELQQQKEKLPHHHQRSESQILIEKLNHQELIRIDLTTTTRTSSINKPFYENDIDPIEYLQSGELILFPNKKILILENPKELLVIKSSSDLKETACSSDNNEISTTTLTSNDLIEYYRLFPNFNWSRYPHLYNWIMNHLTRDERESVSKLLNEYKSFHQQEKQFMSDYRKFVNQFSLTAWFSSIIGNSKQQQKEGNSSRSFINNNNISKQLSSANTTSTAETSSSKKISKEFLQYIFPYVGLLGIFWILKQLFKLLTK